MLLLLLFLNEKFTVKEACPGRFHLQFAYPLFTKALTTGKNMSLFSECYWRNLIYFWTRHLVKGLLLFCCGDILVS